MYCNLSDPVKSYQRWLDAFLTRRGCSGLPSPSSPSSLSTHTSTTHTLRWRERQLLLAPRTGRLVTTSPNDRVSLDDPASFLRAGGLRGQGPAPSSVAGDEREGEFGRETGLAESSEEGIARHCQLHRSTQPDKLVGTLQDHRRGVLVVTTATHEVSVTMTTDNKSICSGSV